MKRIMLGAALVVSLVTAGCGRKNEQPAAPGPEKAKAAAEAPTSAEGPKGPYIAAFRIGYGQAPTGVVAGEGSVFGQGETIFVSFDVPNAPPDGKLHFRWQAAADNKTVQEADVPLSAGQTPGASSKTETKGWPLGDYVLRISLSAPSANFENVSLGVATVKILRERAK